VKRWFGRIKVSRNGLNKAVLAGEGRVLLRARRSGSSRQNPKGDSMKVPGLWKGTFAVAIALLLSGGIAHAAMTEAEANGILQCADDWQRYANDTRDWGVNRMTWLRQQRGRSRKYPVPVPAQPQCARPQMADITAAQEFLAGGPREEAMFMTEAGFDQDLMRYPAVLGKSIRVSMPKSKDEIDGRAECFTAIDWSFQEGLKIRLSQWMDTTKNTISGAQLLLGLDPNQFYDYGQYETALAERLAQFEGGSGKQYYFNQCVREKMQQAFDQLVALPPAPDVYEMAGKYSRGAAAEGVAIHVDPDFYEAAGRYEASAPVQGGGLYVEAMPSAQEWAERLVGKAMPADDSFRHFWHMDLLERAGLVDDFDRPESYEVFDAKALEKYPGAGYAEIRSLLQQAYRSLW